jgi:hypothetical protein
MSAVKSKQTRTAFAISKEDQLFTQNFYSLGYIAEILGGSHHQPVFPEPFARRRPRTDVWNVGQGYGCPSSF